MTRPGRARPGTSRRRRTTVAPVAARAASAAERAISVADDQVEEVAEEVAEIEQPAAGSPGPSRAVAARAAGAATRGGAGELGSAAPPLGERARGAAPEDGERQGAAARGAVEGAGGSGSRGAVEDASGGESRGAVEDASGGESRGAVEDASGGRSRSAVEGASGGGSRGAAGGPPPVPGVAAGGPPPVPGAAIVPALAIAVHDAAVHAASAQAAITSCGHATALVATGSAGLARMRAFVTEAGAAIDALLVGIPGGESLIEAARARPARPVIIAGVSSAAADAVREAVRAGADLVAPRPYDPGGLAPVLLAAARLRDAQRALAAAAARRAPQLGAEPGSALRHVAGALEGSHVAAVGRGGSGAPERSVARPLPRASAIDRSGVAPLPVAGDRAADRSGAALAAVTSADLARGGPSRSPRRRALQPLPELQAALEQELHRARRASAPLAVALIAVELPPPAPPPGVRGIMRARAGTALIHALRDADVATALPHDLSAALARSLDASAALPADERFLVLLPHTELAAAALVTRGAIAAIHAAEPITHGGRTYVPRVIGAVAGAGGGAAGLSFARLMREVTRAHAHARRDGAELAVPVPLAPEGA